LSLLATVYKLIEKIACNGNLNPVKYTTYVRHWNPHNSYQICYLKTTFDMM